MGYTWGYLKKSALAKLDLTDEEATVNGWLNRFTAYANEVITQVCSTIKPKYNNFEFDCTIDQFENGRFKINVDDPNFISFNDNINSIIVKKFNIYTQKYESHYEIASNEICWTEGYNTVVVTVPGHYTISYNARWIDFSSISVQDNLADNVYLDVPNDILECIPSYIASQCYGIDDEYKAARYRNEFEMLFARIDAKPAEGTTSIHLRSDW